MRTTTRGIRAVAGVLALMSLGQVATAADHPYTEGPVSTITSIRTVDGMFEDYMTWLAGPWKQLMEAQKQAGIIVGYHVFMTSPRGLDEPDLYLEVTYKNMAAMDNLDARVDPISEKIMGSMQKATADQIARGKMRTVLGDQMIRELALK